MFLVRSLREKGAMVEVVQQGVTLYKALPGYAACETEVLTDDIKNQTTLKYIRWEHIHEKAPIEKVAEEAREDSTRPDMEASAMLAAQDQFEAAKSGEANEPRSADGSEQDPDLGESEAEEEESEADEASTPDEAKDEEFYTADDYQSMKKAELQAIIDKYDLSIDKTQLKVKMIEALTEFDIPKE